MKRYGNGIVVSKGGGSAPWEDGGARYYYADSKAFDSMANVGNEGDVLFSGYGSAGNSTPDGVDYLLIVTDYNFNSYYRGQSSLNGNAILITVGDMTSTGNPPPQYIGRGLYLWGDGRIAVDPNKTGRFTINMSYDEVYVKRNGIWQLVE